MIESWVLAIGLLFFFLTLLWIVSLKKGDVSIVDAVWSLGIVFQPCVLFIRSPDKTLFQLTVILLALFWAIRLCGYLIYRNWGKVEDKRYAEMRANDPRFRINSLFKIFWFQGFLMLIVALPLNFMMAFPLEFYLLKLVPCAVAVIGFVYETVADMQLIEFKMDPKNQGQILDKGLWGLSRHPNYFGEFLFWWGMFFLSLPTFWFLSWLSPVLMSILLLKVSGVSLLEKHMSSNKNFFKYTKEIPPFFPKIFTK